MLTAYIKLIRWPNLLIVAITQYFLQYLVLIPFLGNFEINPHLSHVQFSLFVLANLCLGATGYIINDIIDLPLDNINKPQKVIVERIISVSKAWKYYLFLTILGLLLYLLISWQTRQFHLVLIYVLGTTGMILYSCFLKKTTLMGNLVIGIYCAFVAYMVLLVEQKAFNTLYKDYPKQANWIWLVFIGYTFFAFFSTVYREIVKDLEDMEGDRSANARTLPLVIGPSRTKLVAAVFGLMLLGLLVVPVVFSINHSLWGHLSYLFLGILAPLTHSFILLPKATTQADYHKISQLIKWIMIAGLVYLIFI